MIDLNMPVFVLPAYIFCNEKNLFLCADFQENAN